MKRCLKLLAVWSVVVMLCFGMLPTEFVLVSFAAGTEPTLEGGEYLIESRANFQWINSNNTTRGHTYRQVKDIELTLTDRVEGNFTGAYNGDGFTITVGAHDMNVNRGGLFEKIKEGTVRNLNVDYRDVWIAAGDGAWAVFGAIAAEIEGGLIENCSSTGTLHGRQWKGAGSDGNTALVGGIVGFMNGSTQVNSTVRNCYSNMTVRGVIGTGSGTSGATGVYSYVGGIVGGAQGSSVVENCMFEGSAVAGWQGNGLYLSGPKSRTVAGGILGFHRNSNNGTLKFTGNYVRNATINAIRYSSDKHISVSGTMIGEFRIKESSASASAFQSNHSKNFYRNSSGGSSAGGSGSLLSGLAYGTNSNDNDFPSNSYTSGATYVSSAGVTQKSAYEVADSPWVYSRASGDYELRWRTIPAPAITPVDGLTLSLGGSDTEQAFVITAPTWETGTGATYRAYTAGAADIRYSLRYSHKATAGAPVATVVPLTGGGYSVQFALDTNTQADTTAEIQYTVTNLGTATDIPYTKYTTPEALMQRIGSPTNNMLITAKVVSDTQLLADSAVTTVTWNDTAPLSSAVVQGGGYVAGTNVVQSYGSLSGGVTATQDATAKTVTLKMPKVEFDKISPGTAITLEAWIVGRGIGATHTYWTGLYPPTPKFTPDNTGVVDSSGVAISCSDSTVSIYYTTDADNMDQSTWSQYLGGGINFAAGATELVLKAFTQNTHGLRSPVVTVRYDKNNRPVTGAPTLLMGADKESFIPGNYYDAGTAIHFYHTNMADGTIYYTTNSQTPTEANGRVYDASSPYVLPTGLSSVTVQAVLIRPGYQDSEVAVATISARVAHSTPLVSIQNGSTIANNSMLYLRVKDSELPYGMAPDFYVMLEDPNYGKIPGVNEPYDSSIHETRYTEAQVNAAMSGTFHGVINVYGSGFAYSVPEIWYVEGTGDPIADGQLYVPETPELRVHVANDDITGPNDNDWILYPENIVSHVPARGIKLTGAADATVVYSVAVRALANTQYTNSGTLRLTYTLREAALSPTASPAPDLGQIAPSTTLRLQSGTVGAKIYYTSDGTIPDIENNPNTKLFTNNVERDARPGEFFTVMAVAVLGGLENSPTSVFTYQVPEDTLAPYASLRSGSVPRSSQVRLTSSTAGAVIYYTLSNTSIVAARSEMAAARDASGNLDIYNSNLIRYDEQNPPVVEEGTYIVAVAIVNGMESKAMEYSYTVYGQIGTPQASLATGAVVTRGSVVTLTSSTTGATMYYTIDGSDPQKADNTAVSVGTSVVLDAEPGKVVTVRAYAGKTGMTNSDTATFSYRISSTETGITANPDKGEEMASGTRVSLSTDVTDATIYYTTDGTTPTTSSSSGSTATLSGNPGEIVTVKAIAHSSANQNPPVAVFTYTMRGRTAAPTASIPTGAITFVGAEVRLTAPEGVIYYTTDGKTPTTASAQYVTPIEVSGSMQLKAFAQADGKEPSEVVTYIYTKAGQAAMPTVDVPAGPIDLGTKVTMHTTTEGATIYYTTDNRDAPSADDLSSALVYTDPIEITRPVTLKMIAYKKGMEASIVATMIYTVIEPEPEEKEPVDPVDPFNTNTERLATRRDYIEQDTGPTFKDLVLRDKQTLAVLSAQSGLLPSNLTLSVRQIQASTADRRAVSGVLASYDIAALFDVELLSGGVPIQPSGVVEIGLPIPQGYEDGVISVCRITSDGATQISGVRRAGSMAYIMVDYVDRFAISVPDAAIEGDGAVWWIVLIVCGLGGALLLFMAVYLYRRRRTQEST